MLEKAKLVITLFVLVLIAPVQAYASSPKYSSNNYSTNEVFFGSGGGNQTDGTLNARVSLGETGVGNYSSADYQAYAGFNTTDQPYLEVAVVDLNVTLSPTSNGVLTTSQTATGTARFYVRAWLAHGYTIQSDTPPPQNVSTGYALQTNTTPTAPATPGTTEQFGMNLVADTSPTSLTTASPVSASPVQTTSQGVGQAACMNGASYINADHACYNQTNLYNYNFNYSTQTGDVIAWSAASSSETIYTISYIYNITNATPSGTYNFYQSLVAVGTY